MESYETKSYRTFLEGAEPALTSDGFNTSKILENLYGRVCKNDLCIVCKSDQEIQEVSPL